MVRPLAVLLSLLVVSPLAAATFSVSAEAPLTPPDYGQAPYQQNFSAIASTGNQALAVWTDERRQLGFGALMGTRLSANGAVLDPNGLLIDADIGQFPAIAANGNEYFIVASERNSRPTDPVELFAWRVGTDGAVRDSRVLIGELTYPKIVSNGSQIAIGGYGYFGNYFVLGNNGSTQEDTLGDIDSIVVPVADGNSFTAFADVYRCTSTCKTRIAMERPGVSAIELFDVKDLPMLSAIASNDGRFLLAWSTIEHDNSWKQYTVTVNYAIVDRQGTLLFAPTVLDRIDITRATAKVEAMDPWYGPEAPAVAWDGKQFIAAWSWFDANGTSEVRATRITTTGTRVDTTPLVLERVTEPIRFDPWRAPQIAVTNAKIIFTWTSSRIGNVWKTSDVAQRSVSTLDELAQTQPPALLAGSPNTQEEVDLAAGDDSTIAAWIENDSYSPRVVARVFPYAGAASSPVIVSTSSNFTENPAVGWGGGVYLVAWREEEYTQGPYAYQSPMYVRVMARRYDRAGKPLEAAPIELAREATIPNIRSTFPHKTIGIASDGQQFLVVWGGVDDLRTHAARVTASGTVLDKPAFAISVSAYARRGAPHPVWNGSEFLVVWYENPTPTSSPSGPLPTLSHVAAATRVSPNGSATTAAVPIITTQASWQIDRSGFFPARNASEMLVTWSIRRNAPEQTCSYGQKFDLTGKAIGSEMTLACATGGGWFLYNGDPQGLWFRDAWWIYHSNLGAEGGLFLTKLGDATRLPIASATGRPVMSKAIVTPRGIVVAYSRIDETNGNVRRIFLRTISDAPARGRAVRH